MTYAQFDALMGIELQLQRAQTGATTQSTGSLPHPSQRQWGSINDLKALEARSNGR